MHEQKETFEDRLKGLFPGDSYDTIAKKVGVSKSAIATYMKKNRVPKESTLKKISDVKLVTTEWLRYGTLPKYIKDIKQEVHIDQNDKSVVDSLQETSQTKEQFLLDFIAGDLERVGQIIGEPDLRKFLLEQGKASAIRELDSGNGTSLPKRNEKRA